ncbi:hypothetical protein MA16_Dca012652 [Dendrobium catenatum]|uniref:Trafficking protein particle complex subunit 13 N-terminal domain-containing protein n=1 Tax=Dendrobium catenatum TaxID=906689 RepID=A0A2I0VN03_9ASPA|nr:hypothetical protein MA16_Dca012652 [Dendrobium catenatum]
MLLLCSLALWWFRLCPVVVAPDGIVGVDSVMHGLPAPSNYHVSPVVFSPILPSLGGSPVVLVESVVVLDSPINVGLVRSSPVLSPVANAPADAFCSSISSDVDGELVVYGGVDGVVSPNLAPANVDVSDINCCVNFNDSPSYVDGEDLVVGKSTYSVDSGEEALAIVGEAGVEVPLVDVPISIISNANLFAHLGRDSVRCQCDWLHDNMSVASGEDFIDINLETCSLDNTRYFRLAAGKLTVSADHSLLDSSEASNPSRTFPLTPSPAMSDSLAGGSPSNHSLAFRVMRLCRPSFQAEDSVLRLDPFDLLAGEDLFNNPGVSSTIIDQAVGGPTSFAAGEGGDDFSFRGRFQLQNPSDAIALPGFLILPQSFGAIYLGETFCSYISINNSSRFEARDVVIKVILFACPYCHNVGGM